MTIVTRPITGDRKDEKDKEALVKKTPNEEATVAVDVDADVELQVGRVRRTGLSMCVSHLCLLIVALIALTVGIIGSFHIYRTLSTHHYLRGYCRMPFPRSQEETLVTGDFSRASRIRQMDSEEMDRMMLAMDNDDDSDSHEMMDSRRNKMSGDNQKLTVADDGDLVEPLRKVVRPQLVESLDLTAKINPNGGIELDYELDLDLEEYESLQLPEISHGRYLHDFRVNLTAIIDPDGQRCFVMPLNRAEISPPRSLFDIISKMKDGAFELNLDEIRHETRVILPPVESLEKFGFFIMKSCEQYKTYRLEEVTSTKMIVKRSADQGDGIETGFVEFAGKSLIRYVIQNIDDTKTAAE